MTLQLDRPRTAVAGTAAPGHQRREIQGLRALAVTLVVLFHLWPDRVPGGYIGVDVFFVISGFLITSHMLREVDRDGRVRLARFWARRLRRLLPAAYLVLTTSAVAVLVLVPRLLWAQFFKEILASGLYVENWTLAFDSVDYLAAENQPSPAQHYWTLSAEEQFYLLWPLLVLLGIWLAARFAKARTRSPRGAVFGVLATAVAVSLAYSSWITVANPSWSYFVTPARAWEFGAGALLAFAPAVTGRQRLRAAAGWGAILVLLAGAFVFDQNTPMPGWAAVVVVSASMLVIWVADPRPGWAHSRLLTARAAEWFGDISYSVYLWHWPLIIVLPYATGHPLTTLDKGSVLMATVALSALTKKYVEDPVRTGRRWGLPRSSVTFAYAAAGAVLLTAVSVVPRLVVAGDAERAAALTRSIATKESVCFGAASRAPRAAERGCPDPALEKVIVPSPAAAAQDWPAYGRCNAPMLADPLRPCRFGKDDGVKPHLLVVGDSHARVLMSMVERLVDDGRVSADMLVIGGCPWSTTPPDLSDPVGRRCAEFRRKLEPLLQRTAKDYDAILTTARISTLRGSREERVAGLAEAMGKVARLGVPIGVLRDNPGGTTPQENPNLCLSKVSPGEADRCAFDRRKVLDRRFDALSAAVERTPGTRLIDLTRFYCDEQKCPVVIGGADVYVDSNHVSVTYARTLAPYLLTALRKQGVL